MLDFQIFRKALDQDPLSMVFHGFPVLHNIPCRLHRGSDAPERTCVYGKSNRITCIGHRNLGDQRVTLGLARHGLAKLILAMRWLCGGYAVAMRAGLDQHPQLFLVWTSSPSRLLDFLTLRSRTALVWTNPPSFSLDLYLPEAINS